MFGANLRHQVYNTVYNEAVENVLLKFLFIFSLLETSVTCTLNTCLCMIEDSLRCIKQFGLCLNAVDFCDKYI